MGFVKLKASTPGKKQTDLKSPLPRTSRQKVPVSCLSWKERILLLHLLPSREDQTFTELGLLSFPPGSELPSKDKPKLLSCV